MFMSHTLLSFRDQPGAGCPCGLAYAPGNPLQTHQTAYKRDHTTKRACSTYARPDTMRASAMLHLSRTLQTQLRYAPLARAQRQCRTHATERCGTKAQVSWDSTSLHTQASRLIALSTITKRNKNDAAMPKKLAASSGRTADSS